MMNGAAGGSRRIGAVAQTVMVSYPEGHDIWLELSLPQKVALLAEILAAYIRVRRDTRISDIQRVVKALRETPCRSRIEDPDEAAITGYRLGWAVQRTLRWLPGNTRCLVQSLVLTVLLARRGIASSVIIGVRTGAKFSAHAWVEHAGQPLLPAVPMGIAFERLAQV